MGPIGFLLRPLPSRPGDIIDLIDSNRENQTKWGERNMLQMKEQDKTSEKEINEIKISNMLEEFKVIDHKDVHWTTDKSGRTP